MKIDRRYHLFSDYLRTRFGDRLQKVTISGGLVCPAESESGPCVYCRAAHAADPSWGRGAPPHEQIRRAVNFSKRKHHPEPHLHITVPNHAAAPPPLDHVEATLESVIKTPGVSVVSFGTRTEWATNELTLLLSRYVLKRRDIWLELDEAPDEWPGGRRESLFYGVQIDLGLGPTPSAGNGDTAESAARLIQQLKPDAVSIKAPAAVTGTAQAKLWEDGRLPDIGLDQFADRAATFLERISRDVAVNPLVLNAPGDSVVGPRWVHNRQKVEEAINLALEARGGVQGGKVG
ncbi:MAG: hypothetical protein SGI90_14480 [Candidatus Eisenbacteria bacterium]|nr:hypothetical protein [Candidatus Eisenbacteria bacterium]